MRLTSALVLLGSILAAAATGRADDADSGSMASDAPVVAVGDVHGDYREFVRILRHMELIDRSGGWIGGTRRLVQTGDLVDRGAESRRVVESLMRLEREAKTAGGAITVLLGNHEVMNITGELDFVSEGEFLSFARDESAAMRKKARAEVEAFLKLDDDGLLRSNYRENLARDIRLVSFDVFFPQGYFAHRKAYAPDGKLGAWLLKKNAVHIEAQSLFVHGGLSSKYGVLAPKEVNRRVRADLERYFRAIDDLVAVGAFSRHLGAAEAFRLLTAEQNAGGPSPRLLPAFRSLKRVLDGPVFADDGPFWYRELATASEPRLARHVDRVTERHSVRRIIIGHTQDPSLRVRARFGGRVFLIDTGMNQEYYGGVPSALGISGQSVQVFEIK
ncbi:MAG: metallophosphoesterase [Planctomycetota bacterium]